MYLIPHKQRIKLFHCLFLILCAQMHALLPAQGATTTKKPTPETQKISLKTLSITERQRLSDAIDKDLSMPDADRKAIQKALANTASQLSKKDLDALSSPTLPTDVTLPPDLLAKIKDKPKASATLLSLPVLGKAKLEPYTDELTRTSGFHLTFTKDGARTLQADTIALEGAKFDFIEEKMTANGSVNILGKQAKIGIKKVELGSSPFVIGTIILQLKFGKDVQGVDPETGEKVTKFKSDPVVITLPNGKDITLKSAYLTLGGDEGAPLVLSSRIKIFGQKAKFSILFDLTAITAKLELKKVPLVSLAPELKQTMLNNWEFKKLSLMIDLWRASFGRPEVAKIRFARRMTCTGTIAKRPLELPTPVETDTTDYAQEELQSLSTDLASEPVHDATASVTPAGTTVDNLADTSATIKPEQLAAELPEPAPLNEDDPALNFSSEKQPDDIDIPFVEEPAEDAQAQEAPEESPEAELEEPEPEPNTEFSGKIVISRAGLRLSIHAQELPINKVGVLDSADISLIAERSRTARTDILQFYPKTDKRTLNNVSATLEVTGDSLPIKNIGTLKTISFMVGLTKKEREKPSDPEVIYKSLRGKISIGGVLQLDIEAIGGMTIDVEASYTHRGFFFKGVVDTHISYKELELQQLKVLYGYPVLEVEEQLFKEKLKSLKETGKQAEREVWREKQEAIREAEEKAEVASSKKKSTATFQKAPPPRAKEKALSIVGTVKLFGITFLARADIRRNPQTQKRTASFSFTSLIGEIRPFRTTDINVLKDCGLNDVIASIVVNPVTKLPMVILSGKAALGDVSFPANLLFVFTKGTIKPCIVIFSDEIADKHLSDLIPGLPSTVDVECKAAHLLLSICKIDTTNLLLPDNIQKLLPKVIPKGLSINANVPLTGSLEKVSTFLGMGPDHAFQLKGAVDFSGLFPQYQLAIAISSNEIEEAVDPIKRRAFLETKMTAEVKEARAIQALQGQEMPMEEVVDYDENGNPLPPKQKPKFSFDSISIVIKNGAILGGAPSAGIEVVVLLRPTPAELLSFKGALDFTGISVDLGAQMLGTWHNPFGLQGWELSDVGLIAGFLTSFPPFPVKLGGAAQLKIKEDFFIAFKLMADVASMNFAIEGTANKVFTIFDIFNLFVDSLKLKIPKVNFPIEISDFHIKFAREQVKILDQVIEPGFALKGKLKIFDKQGAFEGKVDGSGVKFLGTLEKTIIPQLFYLTDAQETGDPIVDIELSLARQKCLVSGMVGFGPGPLFKQKTFLEVSERGMKADFETAIGDAMFDNKPLLDSRVICNIGGSFKDPQAQITVSFQQNLQKFIRKAVLDNVDTAKQKVIQGITQAQDDLKVLDQAKQFANQNISQIIQNIENLKQVAKKFDDAEADVVNKLKSIQNTVNDIDRQLEDKKRWYYSLPKV
jgi:hypothetical protein